MSRTFHRGERHIRVHGVRREVPDMRKYARAVIHLAQAQAEVEAEAAHREKTANVVDLRPHKPGDPQKGAA